MKKLLYFLLTKTIGTYINTLSYIYPKKAIELAHKYFSNPRKGKFTAENLSKTLKAARLEAFQSDDYRIQTYVWDGNQTVIFLVHGWESNSSRWKKLLPYLHSAGSTIVAIDSPAQGLSSGTEFTVPQYAAFVDVVAQKYKPNYIIGHSMGGTTSLYYQYRYKNPNLKKIISLGAACDMQIIFENFIHLLGLNSKIDGALKLKYEKIFNIKLEDFSAKNFAREIKIPGLIIHDFDDEIVLFKEGEKIANAWKQGDLIKTNGLGHKLHDDKLYKQICQYLFEPREN